MKPTKLMAVALCAAACITTTTFAEDDFGIESASPVKIADPVNPQRGVVANAYFFDYNGSGSKYKEMTTSIRAIKNLPAVSTFVDKGEKFSAASIPENIKVHTVMWEGYIKCIRAATYTFSFSNRSGDDISFFVNGTKLVDGDSSGQVSRDVSLKVGWNHIVIVAYFPWRNNVLSVNYKPKGSLAEPRVISPKDLFHEQKIEGAW